ncbi:MAG TPA: hypothetical protein PK346_04775, partial [Defluviitoga tunisiensis]|nr:hypothetical protein [Defluviitoga tunisiensis]
KRKVQKISPRHQSKRLVPCGVHSVDTKGNYIEILRFKQFHDHLYEQSFKDRLIRITESTALMVKIRNNRPIDNID